jgi:aspartyl-tRNA(Asn)/glutamyl-tRNA(Gln) amidotransferase subunit C
MSLDTATVRRVAALARIRLPEEEVARVQGELNGILGWIEQLQAVDTEGVEPMAGGTPEGIAAMPMREDVVTDGGIAEKVLANAPDREGVYFGVPKVVE